MRVFYKEESEKYPRACKLGAKHAHTCECVVTLNPISLVWHNLVNVNLTRFRYPQFCPEIGRLSTVLQFRWRLKFI